MYPTQASKDVFPRHRSEFRALLSWALLAFLLACVFDPADKLLGAKVWIYLLCWLFVVADNLVSRERPSLPIGVLAYVGIFILIPLLSIIWYMVRDGSDPYGGFILVKGYILITFSWLLISCRVNLFRKLAVVLTCLAVLIIATYLALLVYPDLYLPLYVFGEATGVLQLDSGRDYGGGVVLSQVYFVTSPMLAISIAYYYDKAVHELHRRERFLYLLLTLINFAGMLLAGSRNNILMSVSLLITLWFMYTRHKFIGVLGVITAVITLGLFFQNEINSFLDPTEVSNSVKLQALGDYATLFEDPVTLLFGQGLGAYQNFTGRGSLFVTELTYHELFRSFGIFGAVLMLGLLVFPVYYGFIKKQRFAGKAVLIGYSGYLVMCISNPLLFSSMGTLILSMILYLLYERDINVVPPLS
jgi:hypothetical protein